MRPPVESKPAAGAGRNYTRIEDLLASLIDGEGVWIRGRVHRVRKSSGKTCFLVLRQRWATVQTVIDESEEIPRAMVNWVSKLRAEAIVDVYGKVVKPREETSTSQSDVEVKIEKIFLVANALEKMPLRVQDSSVPQPLLDAQRKEIAELDAQITAAKDRIAALEEEKTAHIQKEIAAPQTKSKEAKEKLSTLGDDETAKKALQTEIDAFDAQVAAAKAKMKTEFTPAHDAKKKEIENEILELEKKKGSALKHPDVDQSTRLNNRVIDLRTVANQAIFSIQSAVVNLFRDFLNSKGFNEIHSPKLISAASEGGAEVFEVKYFNTKAYLAQSPQFYKQMAISADFERVYEIGPVFRAELSDGPRHMTEFTGLDMEMQINEHYHEVLDVLGDLFVYIFKGIETRFARELEAVRQQYPFRPFKYLEKTLRLEWPEAIAMLRGAGVTIGDLEDMNAEKERVLGRAVYEKYGTDFYIVDKFPAHIRPFYSMLDPEDPTFANAYDMFMRGEEICSGAQRVHDPELLVQRAKDKGVDPSTVQDYINAFRYGAPPHGGGGVGLDRVVMLYLGLNNIRKSAMFPRDPYRLTP